jgi:hypothetical protein
MENIQHEFFIWEENNYIEQKKNDKNNNESVHYDTTTEIKNDLTQKDWKDITDPKERRKVYLKTYNKKYRISNRKKIDKTKKEYYNKNKETINYKNKLYKIKNKDKIKLNCELYKDKRNEKRRKRMKCDVSYKLQEYLRNRLYLALKNNQKNGSAIRDLGCSVEELKQYIESKFLPGMTWDNYGYYGWHIDHITPLSSFDLTNRQQLLEACHYTNLQPMWAKDNMTKSDKILTIIQ